MALLMVNLAALQTTAQAGERLSRGEIRRLIVGKTVAWDDGGQSSYSPQGRYRYTGRGHVSEGVYVINDGGVCMKLSNGRLRCDAWYKEGAAYYIQTTRPQLAKSLRPSSRYNVLSVR